MSKPRYKAVIFDFDDTLVESRAQKWAQHKHVAKKFYNIDLKEEIILKHWGKPLPTLVAELYQNSDTPENMMNAAISTRKAFPKKPYKDSAKVVKQLVNNGIQVGILSAATARFIKEDLIEFDFPVGKLLTIQGAYETMVHKPNPGVFIPIFKKLKKESISQKDTVYVGDSLDDLQAAKRAGIDFIAVTTGLYSKEDFKKHEAKVIVKDIRSVIKFLIN